MKILSFINEIKQKKYLKELKEYYSGPQDLTIISNNCIGGIVSHNLQLKFYSPTVNLGMEAMDFLSFISDLGYYLKKEISFYNKNDICPWGQIIGDENHPNIHIRFVHYKTFEEGKLKWEERASRITKNIIFIFDFYDEKYDNSILQKYYDIAGGGRIIYQ